MGMRQTIRRLLTRRQTMAQLWKIREKAKNSGFYPIRRYYYGRYWHIMARNGASIALGAEFAGAPKFPHGIAGIFVSEGAKVGKDCVIFHQVTLGSNTLPGSRGVGCPVIGDNVYIGCGAKIIGNVHIGNNVRIGANCVVTRDVPDNATVVLEQPRVILRQQPPDNRWLSFEEMTALANP